MALADDIAAKFATKTTAQLIRKMERASASANLDDETYELARRLDAEGKRFRWTRDLFHPTIVVEPTLEGR